MQTQKKTKDGKKEIVTTWQLYLREYDIYPKISQREITPRLTPVKPIEVRPFFIRDGRVIGLPFIPLNDIAKNLFNEATCFNCVKFRGTSHNPQATDGQKREYYGWKKRCPYTDHMIHTGKCKRHNGKDFYLMYNFLKCDDCCEFWGNHEPCEKYVMNPNQIIQGW